MLRRLVSLAFDVLHDERSAGRDIELFAQRLQLLRVANEQEVSVLVTDEDGGDAFVQE